MILSYAVVCVSLTAQALALGFRESQCMMETRRNNAAEHLINHHHLWPCEGCGRFLLAYEIRRHKVDCDGCETIQAANQYYYAKLYKYCFRAMHRR